MASVKQRLTRSHALQAEHFTPASEEAWERAGQHWHAQILRRHFEPGAWSEYLYTARSRSYRARKQRKHGHDRPLVFSGVLERDVLRVRDVRAKGARGSSGGRAQVVLHGPRYLYTGRAGATGAAAGRAANAVSLSTELAAVSERDARELAAVLERSVVEALSSTTRSEAVT